MSAGRLRLLLLAPACDGTDTGEAWSTFQWVARLARRHDATVLAYHKRGRPPLSSQLPGVRVIEWEDLPLVGRWERFNSMFKPGWAAFAARARRWTRAALAAGEVFDLAHQLGPLAPRYPCPVAGLGPAWVLGPVGGGVAAPPGFAGELGGLPWYVRLRALDAWRLRRDPLLRRSFSGAALVLGVAPYVRELLGELPLRRFEVESETGIEELPPPQSRPPGRPGELPALFVGRVIRTKGVLYAVRALARLPDLPGITLEVVGEGDDRGACEAAAREAGLGGRVRFRGRLSRAEVETCYRRARVFVFPSLREASGNVVFESMRHALPVVACRAGGPAHVVDAASGLLVDPRGPEDLVAGLAQALRSLAGDPARVERLGAGARARVAALATWDAKVTRLEALYREVLQSGTPAHGTRVPA